MREEIFIEKTYTLKESDYSWCYENLEDSKQTMFGQTKAPKIFRWMASVAGGMFLFLFVSVRYDWWFFRTDFWAGFVLILLPGAVLFFLTVSDMVARHAWRYIDTELSYAAAPVEERLTLTTEDYILERETGSFRHPWEKRLEAFEHEEAFVLRFSEKTVHFIHKKFLTQSEIEQLRSLPGTEVPKVKPKKRRRVKNKV